MGTTRPLMLFWKPGLGLALMLLGVFAVARSTPDSPVILFGLFSHLLGLLCLASALAPWLFAPPTPQALANRPPEQAGAYRVRSGFLRLLLSLLLLIVPGYAVWCACVDLGGLTALYARGGRATAQVIGREIVPPDAPIGYVHYAFRAEGVAVENRFAVPHADYARYWTGYPLSVTYLKAEPHAYRLGAVDTGLMTRRGLFWLLLLLNALLFFGVPLRWVHYRTGL